MPGLWRVALHALEVLSQHFGAVQTLKPSTFGVTPCPKMKKTTLVIRHYRLRADPLRVVKLTVQ